MLNIFPQTLCSGDSIPLKLNFKDKVTGNPYDLTGSTFGLTVKKLPDTQPDETAEFVQNVNGDSTGVINFMITGLSAGSHWMDVKKWVTTSGTRSTVIPPIEMKVMQSVTSRLS
jgi:hypothetical protein